MDSLGADAPRTLDKATFGELAVNLTQSGISKPGVCRSHGTAYLKSRDSSSFTAQMKDYVARITADIGVGSCNFTVAKTGDLLSKVGDPVQNDVTITSNSLPNTPALVPDPITDSLLGPLPAALFNESGLNNDLLEPGEIWTAQLTHTVLATDPDPLVNTVATTFTNAGGYSDTKQASCSTNLFQPAIDVSPAGFPNVLTGADGATINVSTALANTSCKTFASPYVKTRSSDAFTSALKDFIAPVPTTINTCRTVDLPNTATALASNHEPVSDLGLITVSNYPIVSSAMATPTPVTATIRGAAITLKSFASSGPQAKTATKSPTPWSLDTNGDSIV